MVGPFLDVPPSTTLMVLIDIILPPASACNFSSGEGGNFHGDVEKDVVRTETGGKTRYYHKLAYNLRTQIFHMGIHDLGY